jgi:aminopeptidase C
VCVSAGNSLLLLTEQPRASGRCWLFATTNVLRYNIMKKLNLKEFELSQSYLFFYDKSVRRSCSCFRY